MNTYKILGHVGFFIGILIYTLKIYLMDLIYHLYRINGLSNPVSNDKIEIINYIAVGFICYGIIMMIIGKGGFSVLKKYVKMK